MAASLEDRLGSALEAVPGLVSAYLFGSAAEDRVHAQSDVDVAVLLDWRAYPTRAARFEARLSLIAALGRVVGAAADVVVLNDAPPHLARHAMTRGRPVTVRNAALDLAHGCLVQSRAADLEPFLRRARAVKLQALAP